MTKYKEEYIHSDHLLYIQLGENVRKLRKRCHLTQDELAERIEIDQKRVSKIERGEAPELDSLFEAGERVSCICGRTT